MSTQYAVPLHEQEKSLPDKIVGYAGPFDSLENAKDWALHYNFKNNRVADIDAIDTNEQLEWRIVAVEPEVYTDQNCTYEPLDDVYIPFDADYEEEDFFPFDETEY